MLTIFRPLLLVAVLITSGIAAWGIIDTEGLTTIARDAVRVQLTSRAWFIMLTVSVLLMLSAFLAFSRYGNIRLGDDDERPEFSTISWLSMLFAAGMGVGLLYYGVTEPLTHFDLARQYVGAVEAPSNAQFITIFNWGFHAWAVFGIMGLTMAYFSFRKRTSLMVSAPIKYVFGETSVTKIAGWLIDLLAIISIAIGLAGSMAIGVFQIEGGVRTLFSTLDSSLTLTLSILIAIFVAYTIPLFVELGSGMARLSNTAMALAVGLLVFILLAGSTHTLMGSVFSSFGSYIAGFFATGFNTYPFTNEVIEQWFLGWTLNYMVWWIAWAPFVGVFIARISRGRTIREFVLGVIIVPTLFCVAWFGVLGGAGFHLELHGLNVMSTVINNPEQATFFVLDQFPLSMLTSAVVVVAAFLFIVTSVVSAAFVLGMFSQDGDINPATTVKVVWGVILGALGLVMVLSGSIDAVRSVIALGALPFVFVILILAVVLLKALKEENI